MKNETRIPRVLFSCEHGGNRIPKKYQTLFRSAKHALNSHRGWDPGAKPVSVDLAGIFGVPAFTADVSRLLVDLNRSEYHPTGFSEFSRKLTADEKESVLDNYHRPYRNKLTTWLLNETQIATVYHFSIHSFTPVFQGEVRNCEIGILYDPKSKLEKNCARNLKIKLNEYLPELRVRMNYPYKGYMDGFTTQLRRRLSKGKYSGIEIELNQNLVESLKSVSARKKFSKTLALCLKEALKSVC